MNTSYYTGANLIIRRNNYFYPRTIYEGHPLIIQKNCNCSAVSSERSKKKKSYKQICPLPANNTHLSSSHKGGEEDDVEGLLLDKDGTDHNLNRYKEPISPPKKISEEFKDFYFYEKHWRPSSDSSSVSGGGGGGGCGTAAGQILGGRGTLGAGLGNTRGNAHLTGHHPCDTSNWADKMSVEANIVEANGHRDLEIRLCYVK